MDEQGNTMKLIKILSVGVIAGLCGFVMLQSANAQGARQLTSAGTAGLISVTADVAPTATLILNQSNFVDQSVVSGVTTLTGTQTPYTTLAFTGWGGDGVADGVNNAAAEASADGAVYVTLALSTAQTSVTLSETASDLAITSGAGSIPISNLTYATSSTSADSSNVGAATWAAAGTANDGTTTPLGTFTGSGVFLTEQTYNLVVPYGTPSGDYTTTITYTLSTF
jgi:hypothetical protein